MSSAVVKFDNVSKRFVIRHQRVRSFQDTLVNFFHQRNGSDEEFWALRDVSFEVCRGETLGIIGQNGSGKSTILKLMTRILEPTSGRISVDGRVSALIELGAGFHPDLTGRENIYLNGSILGFSRQKMDRLFESIVEFAELERFIDTPVKHYSSGMYARLGFSVAISVDPEILIIDEVLSVGDEAFQRKCLDRISEFSRRGKTIVFVSHGLETVESLCDRIIWLDHGEAKAQGATLSTIQKYIAHISRGDAISHSLAAHVSDGNMLAANAEVRISGFKTLSMDGLTCRVVDSQNPFTVRFEVTPRHLESLEVKLDLCREDGVLLIGSPWCSVPSSASGTPAEIWTEFPALRLLSGHYHMIPRARYSIDGRTTESESRHPVTFRSSIPGEGVLAIGSSLNCREVEAIEASRLSDSDREQTTTGIGQRK